MSAVFAVECSHFKDSKSNSRHSSKDYDGVAKESFFVDFVGKVMEETYYVAGKRLKEL